MNHWEKLQHKIVSSVTAKTICSSWLEDDKEVVFTNGCFDLLHKGHVSYLAQAADEGHFLVVGLNSDASVKRQGKGEERPINDEQARAAVLAGLSFVHLVVIFDEDTPLNLIKELTPSVLVKGADYDANETDETAKTYIVGSKEVKENQGRVVTIPLEEGFSTTNIVNRMKS